MRLHIDRNKCEGTGYCVMVSDKVFDLDENAVSVVHSQLADNDLDDFAAEIEDAERLCPTGAISILK